jgi:peptidoglycan/LPS O-acetylase OafA/YrhL
MPGWLGVCLALGIVLLFAWLSHYSVEKPALRRFRAWRARTLPEPLQRLTPISDTLFFFVSPIKNN